MEELEDYKKTELGWIPEDWEVVRLQEVLVLQRGYDLPVQNRIKGPYPLIASNGKIDNHNQFKVKGPAIITGRSGTIGNVYFEESDCWPLNTALYVKEMYNNYPKFLYYFLQDFDLKKYSTGTGVPTLNRNVVHEQLIKFPKSVNEQKLMAEVLSTWDEAIVKVEKVIATKEQIKQGLMQELLTGKTRFPDFADEPWQEVKLGEVFKERNETKCNSLKLLSITSKEGVIDRDDVDKKDTSNSDKTKYKRIAVGDIGYNTMRMWQGVSGVSELEGIISPAYTVVIPGPRLDAYFMAFLFKLPATIHLFKRYSQGLVDDTLNCKFSAFSRIKLSIPTLKEEQQKIAEVLTTANAEITNLKKQLDNLKAQKKALMQKLLTGQVRVNHLEAAETVGF